VLYLKRIAINGRFLSQPVTGVQRYARELLLNFDSLLSSVAASSPAIEVLVPNNAQRVPPFRNLKIRSIGRLTGHSWEQFELPWYCKGKLLFTPSGGAPLFHDCQVATIPDAAVFATPEAYSVPYRAWYRWLHTRMGKSARRIMTVSEFSKSELVRYCGLPPSKIVVTPLGCDHFTHFEPDPSILARHGLKKGAYVLAVSSHNPNKNFSGFAKALTHFGERPPPFVICGDMNGKVFGASGAIPSGVVQVGRVSDAELCALYEGARCFVFPSFYEGFGLPPLEAMNRGCPVICSGIPALRETCGDAALYCDPADPTSIALRIEAVLNDEALRQQLISAGRKRSQGFLWERTAAVTWSILQEAAAEK